MKAKDKPRKCGECGDFHFNWEKHWCAVGEVSIPTSEYPSSFFPTCKKYRNGIPHNEEY